MFRMPVLRKKREVENIKNISSSCLLRDSAAHVRIQLQEGNLFNLDAEFNFDISLKCHGTGGCEENESHSTSKFCYSKRSLKST